MIAKAKTISCRACDLHEHTDGMDLDDRIHSGFTVGKKGRTMYWYFVWHGNTTGNASIYTAGLPMKRSYIKGDQIINIRFK